MPAQRLTGQEELHRNGENLGWRWSASELLGNTLRGVLAEYPVAVDLGVANGIRTEWDAFDPQTSDGTTVEVKSGAYVQAWHQDRPSKISFGIAPTLGWEEKR